VVVVNIDGCGVRGATIGLRNSLLEVEGSDEQDKAAVSEE